MTHTITAGRIPNLQPAVSTKISVTNAPDLLDEHLARGAVGITHDVHAAVRSGRLAAAQVIIAYDGGGIRRSSFNNADTRGGIQRRKGQFLAVGGSCGGLHERAAAIGRGGQQVTQLSPHHLPRGQNRLHITGDSGVIHAHSFGGTGVQRPVFEALLLYGIGAGQDVAFHPRAAVSHSAAA